MDEYSTISDRHVGVPDPSPLFDFAIDPALRTAEVTVNTSVLPYLADHGLWDMIVLPGSFYVDIALYIDRRLSNRAATFIRNVLFHQPVILSTKSTTIKVEVIEHDSNEIEYKFYEAGKRATSSGPQQYAATLELYRNVLPLRSNARQTRSMPHFDPATQASLGQSDFYRRLHENGNRYGPNFQNVSSIWQIGNEFFGRLTVDNRQNVEPHVLHPTVLDALTQLLASFILEKGKPFVLKSIDRLEIAAVDFPDTLFAHAELETDKDHTSIAGNVTAFDQSGKTYLECAGITLALLEDGPVKKDKQVFAIAANFTTQPIEDSLNFWTDYFSWPICLEFAAYNQLFQLLLDPRSEFRKSQKRIVLLNLEEWLDSDPPRSTVGLMTARWSHDFQDRPPYVLPNGLEIQDFNRYETEYLYKEIFEDKCYLKHGICLPEDATVVDIGANIGMFSLFVLSRCRNAQIYAYEPAPVVYEILRANCEAYGGNVRTVNAGVSTESEPALLTFYEKSSVFSGFHANETEDRKTIRSIVRTMLENETHLPAKDLATYVDEFLAERLTGQTRLCEMTTVGDIIRENRLEKIDLLKIDAEKSELEIIEAINDDDWPKIAQVVIEIHDAFGDVVKHLENLLTKKGFRCVIAQEQILKESGLYNLYATRDDLKKKTNDTSSLKRNVNDFCDALRSFMSEVSGWLVLCICPASPAKLADPIVRTELNAAEQHLISTASGIPNVHAISSRLPLQRHALKDYYDPHTDILGHIPYTMDWYAATGTTIFRTIFNLESAPFKAIVLDCDNTLWGGVCGEAGPSGIEVSSSDRMLQRFMVDQMSAGKLLCLCSKNNEADVMAVFDQRTDLILKREHLASWRINWKSKAENIKSLAEELNLGLNAFIFIDDNPVDCADVRINAPEVLTLQVRRNSSGVRSFLNNVWCFDSTKVTSEDRNRTRMYQQNARRQQFQTQSLSLKDFIDGIQLQIDITDATDEQLPRISQLTFRTNQFNFTTVRRQENEIKRLLQFKNFNCQVIHVSDRFGDYGLVGVILYETELDRLKVDTFLLSCRVLGRGVEHAVLSHLGLVALTQNKKFVELTCIPTKRNSPAVTFMKTVGGRFSNDGDTWTVPADYLVSLKYDPAEVSHHQNDSTAESFFREFSTHARQPLERPDLSGRVQYIAEKLSNISELRAAIEEHRQSQQQAPPGTSPSTTKTETTLLNIWRAVLGRSQIRLHDNFFDVGGSSIKAVQVLAMIKKELKQDLSIVNVFEYPTVALLANKLTGSIKDPQVNSSTPAAILRGQRRVTNLRARKDR